MQKTLPILFFVCAQLPLGAAKDGKTLARPEVESTEVRLMLIDVEATDSKHRPLCGLKKGDFAVRVDGRSRPVYSVDDSCPCQEGATVVLPEPIRFVLYFDFSQLQQDGRNRAVEEAKRWISDAMGDRDRAMVAGYADGAGIKIFVPFTENRTELSAAVDRLYGSTELNDPFPISRSVRRDECDRVCRDGRCACWTSLARDEYRHSGHSFESMKWLLARLGNEPGRKALVLFNQDGTLFPTRYYPVDQSRFEDHVLLVDEVAAQATLSRTAIYSVFSGGQYNPLATNLGANLADFTGGGYNRGTSDLAAFLRKAGRGSGCLYRIGVEPAQGESGKVHRVTIEAGERRLPGSLRVEFLSSADRWMRSAQALLASPEASQDVPLAVAITPVASRSGRWDARVQVILDTASMARIQSAVTRAGTTEGTWEVGALLSDAGATRSWEMVGQSEIHGRNGAEGGGVVPAVVHERIVEAIRPGTYELRAFVRDKWTDLAGGARAVIELPRLNAAAMIGPQVLLQDRPMVRTTLPYRGEAAGSAPQATRLLERGSLPLSGKPVRPGERLEFRTWICPGKSEAALPATERSLFQGASQLLRFDAPPVVEEGGCARVVDALDTTTLAPGPYGYTVRWISSPKGTPQDAEVAFEIASPQE